MWSGAEKHPFIGLHSSTERPKSEAMVLWSRKMVECPLWIGEEFLSQVEGFKCLGAYSGVRGEQDIPVDRQTGQCWWKSKLSHKAKKLSIYHSVYHPTPTYGHELSVMTKRIRSRVQLAEMSFLCRVAGLSLRDRLGWGALTFRRGSRKSRCSSTSSRAGWGGSGTWSGFHSEPDADNILGGLLALKYDFI